MPGRSSATQGEAEARLRTAAAAAREDLRRAAVAGDRQARRALLELGEPAPVPRHWAERGEDEGEGAR